MNEFDKIWNETMGCGACDVKPSEDCISRAATIQIIENKLNPCTDIFKCLEMSEIKEDVERLPSVTPTNEDIREAYIKGYDYGVKDWFKSKTQPSDSNISDPCDGCRYELNSTNGNPCYSCGKYKLTEQQPSENCISILNRIMEYTYGMLTAEKIGLQHLIKSMMDELSGGGEDDLKT